MTCQDLKYEIALSQFPKFGPRRIKQLLAYFPSAKTAFYSSLDGFLAAGIEEKVADEFLEFRRGLNPDQIIKSLEKEGVNCVIQDDPDYPPLLKEIYSAPYILYIRGQVKILSQQPAIAVVGTRKCTSYGERTTAQIVSGLTRQKVAIISGLAVGIDTFAHRAALEENGFTFAVIGSGLDRRSLYPPQNAYLADCIVAQGGAIISEFPLGTPPLKQNFPQRNRLIAGISLGTLVVEAGERSGALITARFALEQNREVMAVPGSIFSPASAGPNRLVQQGARAVLSTADILEALDLKQAILQAESRKILPANSTETAILACLSREPVHINAIVRSSGLETSVVNAALTVMELKGMIKNVGQMMYVLLQ